MPTLAPATDLEKATGGLVSESALTVIGALAGGPLAPLLPILAKSLAAKRQQARVEAALSEIDRILQDLGDRVTALTDSQYKLVNESVLAVLSTTEEDKLKFLRRAVQNAFELENIRPHEAVVLSRIVRDISAAEAEFIVENFKFQRVQLATGPGESVASTLVVRSGSRVGTIVEGLIALGLLTVSEPGLEDSNLLRYSPIAAKLLVLLREPAP